MIKIMATQHAPLQQNEELEKHSEGADLRHAGVGLFVCLFCIAWRRSTLSDPHSNQKEINSKLLAHYPKNLIDIRTL
jgi:hypothetical protein